MIRRKLIPRAWYCKYCDRRRRIGIGKDGSVVCCKACGSGLAPLDLVIAHGSLRSFQECIERRFAGGAALGQPAPRCEVCDAAAAATTRSVKDLGLQRTLDLLALDASLTTEL
ncbi:MAG: hypothetical protein JO086_12085 [Acidimicrobiia bacterium]|nr:hypothetical protein [Acidimicrobiia bacterium]